MLLADMSCKKTTEYLNQIESDLNVKNSSFLLHQRAGK